MSSFVDVGYYAVFLVAVIFSVVTIIRATKFSVIWSSIAMVAWFALAGLNTYVFSVDLGEVPPAPMATATPFVYLSWVWFVCGLVFEILGLTFTIMSLRADRQNRDLEI